MSAIDPDSCGRRCQREWMMLSEAEEHFAATSKQISVLYPFCFCLHRVSGRPAGYALCLRLSSVPCSIRREAGSVRLPSLGTGTGRRGGSALRTGPLEVKSPGAFPFLSQPRRRLSWGVGRIMAVDPRPGPTLPHSRRPRWPAPLRGRGRVRRLPSAGLFSPSASA